MNVRQAYKKLIEGNDIEMVMSYHEDWRVVTYESKFHKSYGYNSFKHQVNCDKVNYRYFSTFHSGNQSHCKFQLRCKI